MNYRELRRELKQLIPLMEKREDSEDSYYGELSATKSVYLGSFMSLDPCGRYHHAISPNLLTVRCESFWSRLDRAAESLGGWIESGEGDPTDIYFCLPCPEEESNK